MSKRLIRLCDELVELLHIEVRSVDVKETVVYTPPFEPELPVKQSKPISKGRVECPICRNLITESNKSLICTGCGAQFCGTCEEWFRDERKRGEGPLCRDCYFAGQEKKEKKAKEEIEMKKKEQEKFIKQGNSIGMKFTHIPAGEFMIGSDEYLSEMPVHNVNIDKPFYLSTYPVTQREWKAVMGDNPSSFKGDDLPVVCVSWDDVQEFVKKLNEKEGTDKYRLPSEAEWEYAARAGTTTKYCFGDDVSKLGDYAWYKNNSGSKTHPVGKKKPNNWGLYDMHGSVWEWVQDKWHSNYEGAPADGSAWENGDGPRRVFRGGGWFNSAWLCRSVIRYDLAAGNRSREIGVRLLKEL